MARLRCRFFPSQRTYDYGDPQLWMCTVQDKTIIDFLKAIGKHIIILAQCLGKPNLYCRVGLCNTFRGCSLILLIQQKLQSALTSHESREVPPSRHSIRVPHPSKSQEPLKPTQEPGLSCHRLAVSLSARHISQAINLTPEV